MAKLSVGEIISKATMFGVGGWVVENGLCQQDRYSAIFRGIKIPFLPMYAVNGVVLTRMADSFISKWPVLARGLAYSLVGSVVEYAGCQIDRHLLGGHSWTQGGTSRDGFGAELTRVTGGCVSLSRSALWAGVGFIAEKLD